MTCGVFILAKGGSSVPPPGSPPTSITFETGNKFRFGRKKLGSETHSSCYLWFMKQKKHLCGERTEKTGTLNSIPSFMIELACLLWITGNRLQDGPLKLLTEVLTYKGWVGGPYAPKILALTKLGWPPPPFWVHMDPIPMALIIVFSSLPEEGGFVWCGVLCATLCAAT